MPNPNPYLVNPNTQEVSEFSDPNEHAYNLNQGFTEASPEQVATYQHQQELQTPGNVALTGAEGIARTLSFGLSDVALRAIGQSQNAKELEEANPGANLLGEGIGFLTPDALAEIGTQIAERTGIKAAGKLGKAIGENLTAPGLIKQVGEAVGDAVSPEVVDLAAPKVIKTVSEKAAEKIDATAGETFDANTAHMDSVIDDLGDVEQQIQDVDNGTSSMSRKAYEKLLKKRDDLQKLIDENTAAADAEAERLKNAAAKAKEYVSKTTITSPELPEGNVRVRGVTPHQAIPEFVTETGDELPGVYYSANKQVGLTPFLRKATEGILPGIASGATEFGLYGVGNVVSEAALSDPTKTDFDLTPTKVLGTIGLSALLGGGFGGVQGILSGLGKAGLESLANTGKMDKLTSLIQNINRKVGGVSPIYDYNIGLAAKSESLANELKAFRPNDAKVTDFAKALSTFGSLTGEGLDVSAIPDVAAVADAFNDDRKVAERITAKVDPNKIPDEAIPRIQTLSPVEGAADNTILEVRRLLNKMPELPGTPSVRTDLGDISADLERAVTPEAKATALFDASKKLSELTADYGDRLPQEFHDVRVRLRDFLDDEGNVGKGAKEYNDLQDSYYRAKASDENVLNRIGVRSLDKGQNFQRVITADSFKSPTPEGIKAIEDYYSAHEDLANKAKLYRDATGRFDIDPEALQNASMISSRYHANAKTNNANVENATSIGGDVSDLIGAHLAGQASQALGHGIAHVLGAGVLGGTAVHLARKVLPKLFKYALDNPGEAAHVVSTLYAATQYATKQIERGAIQAMSKNGGESTPKRLSALRGNAYDKMVSNVLENANNPSQMLDKISAVTSLISKYAPNTAAAISGITVAGVNYLAANMPMPGRSGVIGPKLEVPTSEKAAWMDRVDKVLNPLHVLDDIKSGILTPQGVDAIWSVHPDVASRIAQELLIAAEKARSPMTGTQELMVNMFLRGNITGGLGSTLSSQVSFASASPNSALPIQKASSGSPSAKSVTLAERLAPATVNNSTRDRP